MRSLFILLLASLAFLPQAAIAQEAHNVSYFTAEDVFIVMGSEYDLKVVAVNYYNQTDNITIRLAGYDLAWFTSVEGDHTWLTTDQKQVSLENVLTNETRELNVRIVPKPTPNTYTLRLLPAPILSPLTDQDSLTITVGYAPSFPGLELWSIMLAALLAGTIFWRRTGASQL